MLVSYARLVQSFFVYKQCNKRQPSIKQNSCVVCQLLKGTYFELQREKYAINIKPEYRHLSENWLQKNNVRTLLPMEPLVTRLTLCVATLMPVTCFGEAIILMPAAAR